MACSRNKAGAYTPIVCHFGGHTNDTFCFAAHVPTLCKTFSVLIKVAKFI